MLKMTKRKKIFLIIGVLVVALIAWFYFKNKNVVTQYNFVTLNRQDLSQEVSEVGTVKASKELELNFAASGKVKMIAVKNGDKVKKDQVLLELDYSSAQLRVKESESALRIAQANLDKLINGATKAEIDIYRAQVNSAKVAYDAAVADLENVKNTTAANIVTAENNLENSKITSAQNVDSSRDSLLNTLSSKVSAANAAQDYIDRLLDDTDVKDVYSVKNTYYATQSKNLRLETEALRTVAENDLQAVQSNFSSSNSAKAISSATAYLNKISLALNSCFNALENTITYASLTQTELDAYKSGVSSHITAISSASSLLSSADYAYKSALTAQQSSLVTYTQALNISKINASSALSGAQAKIDSTRESWNLAQSQLTKLTQSPRREDISLSQAQLAQAQASLDIANKQIQDSRVVAPIDGTVSKINYEVGEQVTGAKAALAMITDNNFEIELDVSEADISKLKVNDAVDITLDAFSSDRKFTGTLYFIEPGSTVISGVIYYKVKIKFLDTPEALADVKEGMTANTTIKTAFKTNILAVPLRSVIERNGSGKVVRRLLDEKKGTVEEVPVTIGLSGKDGLVEILDGSLQVGDKIVTSAKTATK